MYLIYCDETNLNAKDGDFFIYGGIVIDFSRALELSNRLQQIRSEYKVPKDFKLKFAPPPEQVLAEDFNHLKQQYIEAAIQCGSKFLVSMIHSNIMTNAEDARLNEINRIAYHYNCLLTRENTHGLFILDRFNSKDIDEHIRTKASSGIEGMPYSKEFPLDRIVGFHYSAIGQSHFTSLSDILIGTFRFVINAITKNNEEKKLAISKQKTRHLEAFVGHY